MILMSDDLDVASIPTANSVECLYLHSQIPTQDTGDLDVACI